LCVGQIIASTVDTPGPPPFSIKIRLANFGSISDLNSKQEKETQTHQKCIENLSVETMKNLIVPCYFAIDTIPMLMHTAD
jgi:hypothetical protein